MKAESNPAYAVSRSITWHNVNWRKAKGYVRRLQARIVKATQAQKGNLVKRLQFLLTHSFYGKLWAVRKVTENQGKRTSGVDQVTWETPEKKIKAVHSLRARGYQPLPLKRVIIPKANGQKRPLGIPTMKDRAMQALHLLALDPVAETTADHNSYGFRKERSTADALAQCFKVLARTGSAQYVLEADIKGCFDNLSHEWLRKHVPMDKTTLRKWLKAGILEKGKFSRTEAGTPQGGIISPVLANLALDGMEDLLFVPSQWQRDKRQTYFIRYADDFIITSRTKERLENEVLPLLKGFLEERGLQLSEEKTKITHIEEGFDFLGQNIRKYNGKLLIKPSKKNIGTFLDKIRGVIKDNPTVTAGRLIGLLNPSIRGWANYHRHVVSKEIFSKIDSEIFQALWTWCARRHPHQNRHWIRNKYFQTSGGNNWVFCGEGQDKDGKPKTLSLRKASHTPIVRHVKIRKDANPYNPEHEEYFESRSDDKMRDSLKGQQKLMTLWRQQKGICPICHCRISAESKCHTHHIIHKANGGSEGNENLVMLHPNCHRLVHSTKLEVVKPRP